MNKNTKDKEHIFYPRPQDRAPRAVAKALELELFASASPSNVFTAIKEQSLIDGQKVVEILRKKHNIAIAGCQNEVKRKIFRIFDNDQAKSSHVPTNSKRMGVKNGKAQKINIIAFSNNFFTGSALYQHRRTRIV